MENRKRILLILLFVCLQTNLDQRFVNQDGHVNRIRDIIDRLSPQIVELRRSQTEFVMEIEKLLNET